MKGADAECATEPEAEGAAEGAAEAEIAAHRMLLECAL